MSWDDCEVSILYRESIHTARKRSKRRCCECRRFVQPGERYASVGGLVAGEGWWSEVQHLRCFHFARHLNHELKLFGHACVPFGEIESAMREFLPVFHECYENTYDDPLFLTWWFVKKGAEFKPLPGGIMEKDFKSSYPNKEL